jgi:hypothetical protein
MRRLVAIALALWATGGAAASDLGTVFGGYGCTIGPESRRAAMQAGFDEAEIAAYAERMVAEGKAVDRGGYVVLDEATCAIRLPVLHADLTVASPEIAALIVRREDGEEPEANGCFLEDLPRYFQQRYPGAEGSDIYLQFLAQGIVSGDLRFFSSSALRTPPGFRVMTGDCGAGPEATSVAASGRHISDEDFGAYMRLRMRLTVCEGAVDPAVMAQSITVQGGDPAAHEHAEDVNAWLWFEYDMIGIGAGWVNGATWRSRGKPRPPLCHYEAQ